MMIQKIMGITIFNRNLIGDYYTTVYACLVVGDITDVGVISLCIWSVKILIFISTGSKIFFAPDSQGFSESNERELLTSRWWRIQSSTCGIFVVDWHYHSNILKKEWTLLLRQRLFKVIINADIGNLNMILLVPKIFLHRHLKFAIFRMSANKSQYSANNISRNIRPL